MSDDDTTAPAASEPVQPAPTPAPEPAPSNDPGPLASETQIRSTDPGTIETASFAKGSGDPSKPRI